MNEWRFDVVRLREESPERLLALGPGGAALVPLCGEASLPVIAKASRKIQREAPKAQQADLLAILQVFAEGRYTARQLARVIPEEVTMASVLFEKVRVKERAEDGPKGGPKGGPRDVPKGGPRDVSRNGPRKPGRSASGWRRRCIPTVAGRVVPAIEACSEPTRLRRWALRAPGVSDEEFARLVTGGGRSRPTRRRAPRPARKTVRRSSR